MKHRETHPDLDVDGCFLCKVSTVQIAPSVASSTARGAAVVNQNRRDKEFAADQDAYKRLRKNGLQPRSPQGAAQVERTVTDQVDIDMGATVPKKYRNRIREIRDEASRA